jgi:hypothetical protein
MLSKLFRNRARFDEPDPEIRRRSILELSDQDAATFQADLAELVTADGDAGVRRAALSRLTEPALLATFLDANDPEMVRTAALGLAIHGTDPTRFAHPEIRNAAIRSTRDPDSVLGLLGDVGYDAELIQLAVESRHPKVRLAAADKLLNEQSLNELEHASRDRDKNVNRLARTRLDAIRHARADAEKAERRAQELLRALETQLKPADKDHLFGAKLGVIRQDWSSNRARHGDCVALLAQHGITIASLDALQTQFEALSQNAETQLPPVPVAAVITPAADSASDFAQALAGLTRLLADLKAGKADAVAAYDSVHAASVALQDRWLAAADHAPPPDSLVGPFHDVTHALKLAFDAVARVQQHAAALAAPPPDATLPAAESPEQFEALWATRRNARQQADRLAREIDRIAWPDDFATPAAIAAAQQTQADLIAFDTAVAAQLDALIDRLQTAIARLGEAISDGNLSAATGLEAEGRRLLKSLPTAIARRMQGEFNALAARVLELKDWVTYATHPKREELTAEMEALAQTPLEPPAQAEQIRLLRETWKGLGTITSHADRRLFERFNAAAETAFAPCRAYFEQQAEARKFNLAQRRKICDELDGYLEQTDWTQADWKAAERILRAARDEWRKFHPVDRSPGRKVQTRFETLTGRLYELIKGEWDRNVAAKRAVIDEATAIRDTVTDLRAATDQIKGLQRRWRDIGITPRRVDQSLWRDFRAICDAVFGRRDAVREETHQAAASQVTAAEHLLDEYQAMFDRSGPGNADPAVARDFADRFHALNDLPRDALRRLENRFREIDKNYRVLLRQARHRQATAGIERWQRIDAGLSALEVEAAGGALNAAAIASALAAIPDWDPAAPGPFADRARRLVDAPQAPVDGKADERRCALTVEMEIVAGLDTPPADQQRRLALQVARLNQKHRQTLDDDPTHLAERWCRAGPVVRDAPDLRERFFAACRHAIG